MIHSISIRNFLSFKDWVTLSFEASHEQSLESYHVVEVAKGVRLLKLGIAFGANASGKSNLLRAFEFLKDFWFNVKDGKNQETGVLQFLLDSRTPKEPSEFKLTFYVGDTRYVYSLQLDEHQVLKERMDYYPGIQPANIVNRDATHSVSHVEFGRKIKLNRLEQKEINIKCLPNMSFIAAYNQVNANVPELDRVLSWMQHQYMNMIGPNSRLTELAGNAVIENNAMVGEILNYLKEADFNISGFMTKDKKKLLPENVIGESSGKYEHDPHTLTRDIGFYHRIRDASGREGEFHLEMSMQSEGTLRMFGLAVVITDALNKGAFLCIDELESKLHPKLIEFVIEKFLKISDRSQLLVATHYDGLLEEDDLLRKDNIWFTEKLEDGSTHLYSLSDFKAVNRIGSIQKAYKYGRFGAIPNLD